MLYSYQRMYITTLLVMDLEFRWVFQMTEEIEWSIESLRKAIVDSASDYDRIVKNMKENESENREEESTGQE